MSDDMPSLLFVMQSDCWGFIPGRMCHLARHDWGKIFDRVRSVVLTRLMSVALSVLFFFWLQMKRYTNPVGETFWGVDN